MKHSREWRQGDTAQQAWAEELRKRGKCALPTYAFEDVAPETKAPVMLVPAGVLVTPDVLCMSAKSGTSWHEVKSKTVPTWRRLPPGPRWEHGFDYSLVREYQEVQDLSGAPVYVVVQETKTPADLSRESVLVDSGIWLFATLDTILKHGSRRPDWPKRNGNPNDRGRRGEGGWLWARSIMTALPMPGAQIAASTGEVAVYDDEPPPDVELPVWK